MFRDIIIVTGRYIKDKGVFRVFIVYIIIDTVKTIIIV